MRAETDDLNEDPEENRKLAEFMVGIYRHGLETVVEVSTAQARWLISSLLAINGGAAIATWPVAMPLSAKLTSCGAFVLGLLFAMLAAFLSVRIATKASAILGKLLGYWVGVVHDGERVGSIEDDQNKLAAEIDTLGKPSMRAGWTSVLFFVAGVLAAGCGAINEVQLGARASGL